MSNKDQTPEQIAAAEAKAKAEAEAKAKADAKATKSGSNKNVVITFTKPHSRYSRGDVAGFPEDHAKKLVEGIKVAVMGEKLPE